MTKRLKHSKPANGEEAAMTNEDRDGSGLSARAGRERPHVDAERHGEMTGPTGRAPTTDRIGDPDRSSVASGAAQGAGAGILAGTAIAGPIGMPFGAMAGAAVGALAEAVDEEGGSNGYRPLSAPASRGTGPVDPAIDFVDNDRD
jgi:hypothetical protein